LQFEVYSRELSDSSRVSLLTVAPGDELYSAFGHTGIRVTDYKNNFDVVFNYGTFDFEQPGFYTNFLRGKMRYMISTDRFDDFMNEYVYEKRRVDEQELNLNAEDKQKVFVCLFTNALPENREYFYDFFWDNCATRPRDVFEKVLGTRMQYHLDSAGFPKNKTMHDMLREYVWNRPWVDFGFDLILGMPCEVIASPRDQTFLPDYVAKYLGSATVDGQPFVVTTKTILDLPPVKLHTGFRPIHLSLLLVLLGFIITYIERKQNSHFYFFDFTLFLSAGLLGTLFLSLWLFTSHYSVPENLNMFWLLPTHVLVAFYLLKKQKGYWLKYYFGVTYIILMILLIGWHWSPQPFNIAIMPLLFLLALRSSSIAVYIHFKNKP
jgi:hypothetical protein